MTAITFGEVPFGPVRNGAVRNGSLRASSLRTGPLSNGAPRDVALRATHEHSPSHLRLTTRGRRVLGFLAAVVVAVGVLWGGSAVADGGPESVGVVTYTVVAGETWWSIASSVAAPGQDIRDVVRELVEMNGTSAAALQAGQQVLLPVHG